MPLISIVSWETVTLPHDTHGNRRVRLDPGHVALEVAGWFYGFFPDGDDTRDCPGTMFRQTPDEFVGFLMNRIWMKKNRIPQAATARIPVSIHYFRAEVPDDVAGALGTRCVAFCQRCNEAKPLALPNEETRYRDKSHHCVHVTTNLLASVDAFHFHVRPLITPDAFRKKVLAPKMNHPAEGERGVIIGKLLRTFTIDP